MILLTNPFLFKLGYAKEITIDDKVSATQNIINKIKSNKLGNICNRYNTSEKVTILIAWREFMYQ